MEPPRPAARSFPKAARLLKHADFDRVYQGGRRHFASHVTVFFLARTEGGPRVGFTVSRAMGGAVIRNRIRRRLREAVRLHLAELRVPADIVINPKKSAQRAEFSELEREIAAAFALIGKKLSAKHATARTGEAE